MMNASFLPLDTIFFLYGTSFMAVALLAGLLREAKKNAPSWRLLQAFAIVHGLHEWGELAVHSLGDPPWAQAARPATLALSFLLLLSAGFGLRHRLWAMLASAVAGAALVHAAGVSAEVAIRWSMGLPGAWAAAVALARAAGGSSSTARVGHLLGAGALAAYGCAVVWSTQAGGLPLLSDLTSSRFEAWAGFPVQLARAGAALALTLGLGLIALHPYRAAHATTGPILRLPVVRSLALMAVVAGLTVGAAHLLEQRVRDEGARDLVTRSHTAAATLDETLLDDLRPEAAAEFEPSHRRTVRLLSSIQRQQPDVTRLVLFVRDESGLICVASAMTGDPAGYLAPGQRLTLPADAALPAPTSRVAEGALIGPYTLAATQRALALTPTPAGARLRSSFLLGLEVDASGLLARVRVYRLVGLLPGMALILLVLDFFSHQRGYWATAHQLAESEAHLRVLSADLETRVARRTTELAEANAALQREVEAHRAAEFRYRDLTEHLPATAYQVLFEPAPHTVFTNGLIERLTGYRPEEWLANPDLWKDLLHPEDRDRVLRIVGEHDRDGTPMEIEYRSHTREGHLIWIRNTAHYFRDETGRVTRMHGFMTDITQSVLANKRLRETGERYRLLFEQSPVGIFHYDRDLVITRFNRRFAEILHTSPDRLAGLDMRRLRDRSILPALEAPLEGRAGEYEGVYHTTTSDVDVDINLHTVPVLDEEGHPMGAMGTVEETSEKRRLEEERVKSQKLESLGLLAGGIAHDFNNILTAILGNLSIIDFTDTPEDTERRAIVQEAERAALRAKELTMQLLTFAKGGAPVKQTADLAKVAREAATFALRGSSVRLAFETAPDLPLAEIDSGQIAQIVQNLVINADQAMPEGGTIQIALDVEVVDTDPPGLAAGRYLRLRVIDNGVGIPAHSVPKVFDPYFTTKSKGSGLGLTTSHSIARKHGGLLSVASVSGEGSTFTLHLPVPVDAQMAPPESEPVAIQPGAGRILFMDDEPELRTLVARILAEGGYEPVTAAHGAEAILLFGQAIAEGRPFRAVILDLTIPGGLGGRETLEILRQRAPDLPILVASGYSMEESIAQYRQLGFSGVVPKPFRKHDLLAGLQAALSR